MHLRELLPHQVEPAKRALTKPKLPLFLDKRLGKCIVSLRWALHYARGPVLIVAPLSAHAGWLDELEADGLAGFSCYGMEDIDLHFKFDKAVDDRKTTFFLINPQGLFSPSGRKVTCPLCDGSKVERVRDDTATCSNCNGNGSCKLGEPVPKAIALLPWTAVIWDESTNLRNPKSQTNQIAMQCFCNCEYKAILSGEPAPEGPQDYFEQFRFLNGFFMGQRNYWHWMREHFNEAGFDRFPKPGHTKLVKEAVHAQAVVLSRKDAGLGEVKTRERRTVELPPNIRKIYDHCERRFEVPASMEPDSDLSGEELVETKYAVVVRNWLVQLAGGYPKWSKKGSAHKMQILMDLLTGEYAKEQVVVMFRHNNELQAAGIASLFHKETKSVRMIDGSTPPDKRREIGHLFQKGHVRILLMQIKVARFGIDLSAADTMIYYSLPEGYEDISQSMDRIVHPKKTSPLHYIYLNAEDTVDEDIYNALGDKGITSNYFKNKIEKNFAARVRKAVQRV